MSRSDSPVTISYRCLQRWLFFQSRILQQWTLLYWRTPEGEASPTYFIFMQFSIKIMPNEWLASTPSPVWEILDLPLNWNQKMVFQCEFYWVATSLLKARKLLSFFHRAAIFQLWLYSPWPPNVMAYLHCQTRTLIPTRIRTPNRMAILYYTETVSIAQSRSSNVNKP